MPDKLLLLDRLHSCVSVIEEKYNLLMITL